MKIAVWIIAICEVIRAIQNQIQINHIKHAEKSQDNAYAEFIKSLRQSDKEFVRRMLEEYEKNEVEDGKTD